jgi:hypothetical protein
MAHSGHQEIGPAGVKPLFHKQIHLTQIHHAHIEGDLLRVCHASPSFWNPTGIYMDDISNDGVNPAVL